MKTLVRIVAAIALASCGGKAIGTFGDSGQSADQSNSNDSGVSNRDGGPSADAGTSEAGCPVPEDGCALCNNEWQCPGVVYVRCPLSGLAHGASCEQFSGISCMACRGEGDPAILWECVDVSGGRKWLGDQQAATWTCSK
jgi:hypothetical protein